MYLDMGAKRGRVHFTWKELLLIWGLMLSAGGYVLRNELKIAQTGQRLEQCQQQLQQLQRGADVRNSMQTNGGNSAERQ